MAAFAELNAAEPEEKAPGTLGALWNSMVKLDRGKMNHPAMALRNALAVAVPLAAGFALGNPTAGTAVATGALNVAYSDGVDPYPLRARRMLTWSMLGAVAVFSGSAAGEHHYLSIALTTAWAFLAGLLVSISTRAGDLGLNTLVALVVFSARGPSALGGALDAALLVLGGGLLQTLCAVLFWPLHRYDPERRALSKVFSDLAQTIACLEEEALAEPLASAPSAQVQDTLTALGRDRSIEAERFRLLFDQADRIRLSGFLVRRLQSFLAYQEMHRSGEAGQQRERLVECVDRIFDNAAAVLGEVASDLTLSAARPGLQQLLTRASELTTAARQTAREIKPMGEELCSAIDLFIGQVRAAAELASRSTFEGASQFMLREQQQPWRLQLQNWRDTLAANLTFKSASFRHGVRMAVFVAVGSAIGRGISWQRNYWIPMTVAVILKPDFTTTFSRGALRLAGTMIGLLVATALYHAVPSTALTELILVSAFTFVLRRYGPANYGLFSIAITGLIVFLIAAVGIPPGEVVVQRGINTLVGGCLALVAYAVWPTWERRQVSVVMADMIDATRNYFRAVVTEFDSASEEAEASAQAARQEWRRARSNAEASVDRVGSEPRITPAKISALNSMLASSHVLVHAIMGLEAGLQQAAPRHRNPDTARVFAHDVEFTLYYLGAALRGSGGASNKLPSLRDDHTRMVQASGLANPATDYVLVETDRMVITLNTLREQVLQFVN